MHDDVIVTKKVCNRCNGDGTEPDANHACVKCGGTGETHSTMSIEQMTERVVKEMRRGR